MADIERTIKERQERWRALMAGEPGSVPFVFTVRFYPDPFERPVPMPDNIPERIEWIWSNYCRILQQTTWLEDDSLPYLDCLTGTEIFAEAFGADVYRPKDSMPYAYPLIVNAEQADRISIPTLDVPSIQRPFQIADELLSRAGKGALVRTVDVQSPMDIAAILWDKTDLFTAMLDTPDSVKNLSEKVRTFLNAFLDEWFGRYGSNHIAHFPDYYMEGGMTLSEDEIGSVSPAMFDEFFLPELNLLSERYGGIGIHCCANSRHQWDGFKKIRDLRLLNIIQPTEIVQEAYRFFGKDIVHHHSWNGEGDPWTWVEQHPPGTRFVIDTWATSRDEACRMVEKLNEAREKAMRNH